MRKKLIATISIMTMVYAMSTSVFASGFPRMMSQNYNYSTNYNYDLMLNENGDFLSIEDFEQRLDDAVENNLLLEDDKDFYLDMFDYCTNNRTNYGTSRKEVSGFRPCH